MTVSGHPVTKSPGHLVIRMPEVDFFNFFRWSVGWIATIYATIVTVQSLYSWYIWLAGQDRYIGLVRRYVIVHGLRLRFRAFWGDVIICVLLCVAFLLLWRAHHVVYDLGEKISSIRHEQHSKHV